MTNAISYANEAALIATDLIEAKKADDKATSLREGVNKRIVKMHKDKVVVGRYKTCSTATTFVDTLIAGGLAKKTAQNYLSLFKDAVATGKPVLDWGGTKGGKTRKGAKAKGANATGKKEFADKLATCFRDAEFESFINDLEGSFQNDDIATLLEGVKSFLEASGIELK
jgi:hypothetical protein